MEFRTAKTLERVYVDSIRKFIKNNKMAVFLVLLTVLAGAIFGGLAPLGIAKIIDMASSTGFEDYNAVFFILGYVVLKFLGQATIDVRWIVINPLLYKAMYGFGAEIVQKISEANQVNSNALNSASKVSERAAIVSKMQTGLMGILHGTVSVIIPAIAEIIIVILLVYWIIGPSFIGYFAIGAIILFVATSIGRDREVYHGQHSYKADNDVLSYCGEFLSHGKLGREMNASSFFKNKLNGLIERSLNEHQKLFRTKFIRATYVTCAISFSYLCVFVWAGWLLQKGAIEAGQIFLLVIYLQRVLNPITGASAAINNIHHGVISVDAGYQLLDEYIEMAGQESYTVEKMSYDSFELSSNISYQLKDRRLIIGKGKRIRIAGGSGSGKSTFLQAIYKTLNMNKEYNSQDIHYLTMAPELVDGSVYENLTLGDKRVSDNEAKKLLQLWSEKFGNKELNINANVKNLSAGERQWIALGRTILRKPKFVFLDEATNSFDVKTDRLVWGLIFQELHNSTIFIVSHKEEFQEEVDWTESILNIVEEDRGNVAEM